jgi:hypothetical protein
MQKGSNVLPYFVPEWLMGEWHWLSTRGSRRGLTNRNPARTRRWIKRFLNRTGRRRAKHELRNGRDIIKRADTSYLDAY